VGEGGIDIISALPAEMLMEASEMVDAALAGLDNGQGNGVVVEPRLYQLVRQQQPIVDRQFAIEFFDAGVETFAFTFG
jgi:hypothetical protein